MKRTILTIICLLITAGLPASAAVDTLKGPSQIEDCVIYSYENCNPEILGENCRRYNAGGIINLGIGTTGPMRERRALFRLPAWDGTIPDSARFDLFCYVESDTIDRKLLLYPLATPFFEGCERAYNLGGYPQDDSGATWLHAYLDVGEPDSLVWTSPGADFTTAVACTTVVDGPGRYCSFRHFNRILQYWDSTGKNFGFIVVNENAEPSSKTNKVVKSSEAALDIAPRLILYLPHGSVSQRRAHVARSLLAR